MKSVTVTIKKPQESYNIVIGNDLIKNLGTYIKFSDYTKVVLITDKNIWRRWHSILVSALPSETSSIILPSGEKEKTIQTIQIIWENLQKASCDRKSLVINFGGGVIGDIGGFAASTYMRGIDFINIPTTLLSQIDASIGGKTGFDFAGIKNLIGNFTQPKAILIDVMTLQTLPKREFVAGFAEIIKHGLIKDKQYFEQVTEKNPLLFSKEELIEIIYNSCVIKANVVQNDETENENRKILNFGHTIGHAIEAISLETDTPLLHGEAVSIGMAAEAAIAQKIGLLSEEEAILIKNKLNDTGLPTDIPHYKIKAIFEKMLSDKKNARGKINFTLLKHIGEAVINQTVPETVIKEVLKK